VRGAIPWVGRSQWHYGSFHLWGDVPALMPTTLGREILKAGVTHRADGTTNFHGQKNTNNNPTKRHATEGVKMGGGTWFGEYTPKPEGVKQGGDWFNDPKSMSRQSSSKSKARKAASAKIAKIPFALSSHIARVYYPMRSEAA
jgi:hypothetical protein